MGKNSSLTKTGIGNTPETAQYQDSPQATVAAFGKQSVAPEMMSNTNTPGLQFDDSGNVASDAGPQPSFIQTKAAVTPRFQQPSFAETENNPDLARKADTKGGKLLNFFLSVANGGAAGAGQPTFGGGFLMAQHADMQRQKAAQDQRQSGLENQRKQREQDQEQQKIDQNAAENKSQAALRTQQIEESKANTGKKELTDEQRVAQRKAAAISLGIKEGTPEFKEYVLGLKPEKKDNSISPYEDFRAGYPDTPEGRQRAVREYHKLTAKQPGSRAATHADQLAQAEDIAGAFLDRADGDPNKAMEMFVKAHASVDDKAQLALAPKIRAAIHGSRRVQNADPLAGLFGGPQPPQ